MKLKQEKQEVEKNDKCEEYLNNWKRAVADYQNLQKETARQMSDYHQYATQDIIMQILPLGDYFQHAFAAIPEAEQKAPWLTGVKHIQSYFNKILADNNVSEIKSLGEKFNPEFHEVVAQEEAEGEEDIIIKINQAGYKMGEKIIRPAKVIISKKINNLNNMKGGEKI